MIDRQLSGSPWSQTMNRIHSPPPGHESVNNRYKQKKKACYI